EETVAEGLEVAKQAIGQIVDLQREMVASAGAQPKEWEPRPAFTDEVFAAVEEFASARLEAALVPGRAERDLNLSTLKQDVKEFLEERYPEGYESVAGMVSPAFKELQKRAMRRKVIEQGIRLDGRRPDEIRPLSSEVGLIPRAHGSGLFQRGETQV